MMFFIIKKNYVFGVTLMICLKVDGWSHWLRQKKEQYLNVNKRCNLYQLINC